MTVDGHKDDYHSDVSRKDIEILRILNKKNIQLQEDFHFIKKYWIVLWVFT